MVQICKFSSFLCICFICLILIDLSLHRLSTPHEIWHLQKLHTNLRLLSFLTLKCTRHRSLYMLPHSGVSSLATKVAPSLDIARRPLHPILWIDATFVNKTVMPGAVTLWTFWLFLLILFSFLIYNLTHRRMFTSKVWTDDSRLLQQSNLAARQPRRAHITSYRQLRVTDLPKVPTWRLEWDSNQRPFAPPQCHHAPYLQTR